MGRGVALNVTVALLRGINLGKRRMKMADLKACVEGLGFTGVRTVLATGNLLMDGEPTTTRAQKLSSGIEAHFGYPVGVILRSQAELQALLDSGPFGTVVADQDTKLYVTFFDAGISESLPSPCKMDGDYEIVKTTALEVFQVAHRTESGRFGPGLDNLARRFEKLGRWTRRNWNTVAKLT